MSAADRQAIKVKLGAECQAKEGASDADMQALAKHEDPPSHEGKCVIACVMETIGVVGISTAAFHLFRVLKL